jgi:hypothetical protein
MTERVANQVVEWGVRRYEGELNSPRSVNGHGRGGSQLEAWAAGFPVAAIPQRDEWRGKSSSRPQGAQASGFGLRASGQGPKGRRREGLSVFAPHVEMGGESMMTRGMNVVFMIEDRAVFCDGTIIWLDSRSFR